MKRLSTLLVGSLFVVTACNDKKSEPAATAHADPAASPATRSSAEGGRAAELTPDWTFDPEDPARDYVGRYLKATLRYGAETACVVLGKSSFRNGESVVEVRNPGDASCGKPAELRDRFFASVSTDRMRLDDADHHPALRPWPDGSLPDQPPGLVTIIQPLKGWKTAVHDVIKKQQLYALRVQLYGRGTYPVVLIAGWHALFDPKGDLAALKPAAEELCTANNGSPMGFIAELDHTQMLRVDCPDKPHWQSLVL
jgi:hypothetical protein